MSVNSHSAFRLAEIGVKMNHYHVVSYEMYFDDFRFQFALCIIFPYASYNSALKEAGIPSLYDRRASLSSDLFNDIVLDINHKLAGLLPPKAEHHRQLRSNRKFYVPVCKTDRLKKSFIVSHSLSM